MSRPLMFKGLMLPEGSSPSWVYYSIAGKPELQANAKWVAEDLQFIGTRSIDGVDVYEGDILKFPGDDHLYFVQQSDEGWSIFTASGIQMGKPGLAAFMQVVGNVQQNPSARIKADEK